MFTKQNKFLKKLKLHFIIKSVGQAWHEAISPASPMITRGRKLAVNVFI